MSSFVISDIISCLPATATALHCCQSWQAFTATFAKNHGHFWSFYGNQKFCGCIIFQSTTSIKNQENIMFGEGFCHFLFLLSIFGLNITQIFKIKLDLYHNTLLLLTATSTATNFSAQIFFIRPDLSDLPVATATWQHCCTLHRQSALVQTRARRQ